MRLKLDDNHLPRIMSKKRISKFTPKNPQLESDETPGINECQRKASRTIIYKKIIIYWDDHMFDLLLKSWGTSISQYFICYNVWVFI